MRWWKRLEQMGGREAEIIRAVNEARDASLERAKKHFEDKGFARGHDRAVDELRRWDGWIKRENYGNTQRVTVGWVPNAPSVYTYFAPSFEPSFAMFQNRGLAKIPMQRIELKVVPWFARHGNCEVCWFNLEPTDGKNIKAQPLWLHEFAKICFEAMGIAENIPFRCGACGAHGYTGTEGRQLFQGLVSRAYNELGFEEIWKSGTGFEEVRP